MTEGEYWDSSSEFEDEDGEILGEYLIEDPGDLTLIMFPKLEFDLEAELEKYYKILKKCRNKEQIINVLREFYTVISGVTILQNDIQYLQDKAKELEFNIKMLQQQYE